MKMMRGKMSRVYTVLLLSAVLACGALAARSAVDFTKPYELDFKIMNEGTTKYVGGQTPELPAEQSEQITSMLNSKTSYSHSVSVIVGTLNGTRAGTVEIEFKPSSGSPMASILRTTAADENGNDDESEGRRRGKGRKNDDIEVTFLVRCDDPESPTVQEVNEDEGSCVDVPNNISLYDAVVLSKLPTAFNFTGNYSSPLDIDRGFLMQLICGGKTPMEAWKTNCDQWTNVTNGDGTNATAKGSNCKVAFGTTSFQNEQHDIMHNTTVTASNATFGIMYNKKNSNMPKKALISEEGTIKSTYVVVEDSPSEMITDFTYKQMIKFGKVKQLSEEDFADDVVVC